MKLLRNFGFTLIEIMIAMVITSFIVVGIYQMIRSHAQKSGEQTQSSSLLRSSQRARFIISHDLQQAGYDPRAGTAAHTNVEAITAATDDSITMQGDFNSSGAAEVTPPTGDEAEQISYAFNAGNKQITRNSQVFLKDVETFQLNYYNDAGALLCCSTTATAANIDSAAERLTIKQIRVSWTQEGVGNKIEKQEFLVNLRNYRGS